MSAEVIEHPSPPWVELYTPAITPEERRLLEAANSATDPAESMTMALRATRLAVINSVRKALLPEQIISQQLIRFALDQAWLLAFPMLNRITGPAVAEAYLRAFRRADSGDVPIKMIYSLSEEHVRRTGDYFHGTSSDALIQGFNTYVNRKVPEKVALARVLDAYGLTPRQMSGLASAKQFEQKVESAMPGSLKDKIKHYIGRSITERLKVFSRQEAHNLSEQAQQVSWMWMVQHGKLPQTTEKMWITARDEKVCGICGPLHRTKVPVGDQFLLDNGQKLYVPGAHVNCRCTVRLQINFLEEVGKADDFEPVEHPRGTGGRFVRRPIADQVEPAEEFVDPRVQDMLRAAEEIPEEESDVADRLKTAMTLARLKAKLSRPKPSLAEHLPAQQTPSLTDLGAKPEETRSLSEVIQERNQVSLTENQAPLQQSLYSRTYGLDEERSTDPFTVPLSALSEREQPELPRKPRRRRNVGLPVDLHIPHRAIGDPDDIKPSQEHDGDQVVDLRQMPFYSIETPVMASNYTDSLMDTLASRVKTTHKNVLSEPDPRYPGRQIYATIEDQGIEDAITALANEHNPEEPDDYITVLFQAPDRRTPVVEKDIRLSDIARRMGITEKDVTIVVYEVERGNHGQTVIDDRTGHGQTRVNLSGQFIVTDDHIMSEGERSKALFIGRGHKLPVRLISLSPAEVPFIDEDVDEEEGEIDESQYGHELDG